MPKELASRELRIGASGMISDDRATGWLARALLAIGIAIGFVMILGATAWSREGDRLPAAAPSSYTDSERDSVEKADERKVREIREQEVTQLRIALGRRLADNRRADLYLRLSEIYLEMYRSEFLIEGRIHEKRLAKGIPDRNIERGRSKPILALGIKACEDILRLRIPFGRMDQVHYFLGFYHAELDQRAEAAKHFEILARQFPQSPFVVEAYRELGDTSFDNGDFRKAESYYELAAKQKQLGDALPRVLHKLAWAHYRLRQHDRAIVTMKEAIEKAGKEEKFLSLREEALRDMAIFMTETGRVEEALVYFKEVAGDKDFYPRVLERLGRQYERNVEPQKAAQVYESLLKTTSDEGAAFRVRAKLFDLDLRRGRFKDALGRIQGAKIPNKGEGDTLVAAQNLRAMVRRTATEQHEAFRKNGARAPLETAEAYYTAYLGTFLAKDDSRKETPEIRMYLADVKRELGKSKEASELYRQVIDSKDKRYAKEAGALWTASLAEAIRKQSQAGGQAKAEKPSDLEVEFVEAADALQESIGDTAEAREAALKSAQVLAGYRKTQGDAIKRVRKLIQKAPKSAQALTAARLWVQLLSDRAATDKSAGEDLASALKELRGNAQLLAADAELGQGKLKVALADQDQRQKVGAIAAHEKDNDFASAAKGYEQFAAESPSRELAEKAYGNAVGAYGKAQDFDSAERVTQAWLKRYPDSKGALEALRTSATAALIQGRFEKSGALFETLGRATGDVGALETAARIDEGTGQGAASRGLWGAVLERQKQSSRKWTILLALARSYDADQQESEAARHYKLCEAGPAEFQAECGARLADLYRHAQDEENARAAYRRVAALKKNPSPFVGYARYRLAELEEQEARFEPMQLPEAQLKKGMNARLEFLEKLSKAYNGVVEVGGPWGIAALDRLATWVYGFAQDIDRIPPPAGADEKVAASFKRNLKGVSDPLRAKAVQTWADAYRKAVAQEVLSPSLPGIADRLAEAQGSGVGRAQGARGRFRLSGVPADGGQDGRTTALEKVRERLMKSPQDAAAWIDYGNLIWGEGKPLLAKLAYERALSLQPRNPAALNNRAVVTLSGGAEEDWFRAAEAHALLRDALKQDEFFLAAKMNLGTLLNYYRVFPKARALWNQVAAKAQSSADAHEGLAVSLQGVNDAAQAEAAFVKASAGGFVAAYHEAARAAASGKAGAEKCLVRLGQLDEAGLGGFEKQSVENLKRTCTAWKTGEL